MLNLSVYERLKAAGVPLDHQESDLYAKVTPASTPIIEAALDQGTIASAPTFVNQQDGTLWYDLAFMYLPFWERLVGWQASQVMNGIRHAHDRRPHGVREP